MLYLVCISLHLLAASLWLGHMFVWSLFAMPALKRVEPAATADFLRKRSVYLGGLGWPALIVLILAARGGQYAGTENDTQTPHLKAMLGMIGITDVSTIYAEGLAMGDGLRNAALKEARQAIDSLVERL